MFFASLSQVPDISPQLPAGALAVWDANDYSPTPVPHIKPVGYSGPVDSNILRGGARVINPTIAATAGTVTRNFADGWDGAVNRATRLSANPGNWDFYLTTLINLIAGTFTLSFYAKSNTGIDQTFFAGLQASYGALSSVTITPTWSRVSLTVTLVAPEANRYVWLAADYSGTKTADILIDDIRIDQSGTAQNTPAEAGVLHLGQQAIGSGVASVVNGAIQFGSGKAAIAQFASATTFSNFTISAYMKKTGTGDSFAGVMSKYGQYNALSITEGAGIFGTGGLTVASDEFVPAPLLDLIGAGYHLFTFVRDNTYVWLYLDEIPIGRQEHTGNGASSVQDWLFSAINFFAGNLYFDGEVSLFGLWDRSLSSTEIVSLRDYCKQQRIDNGVTPGEVDSLTCFVGDSLTAIRTYPYAYPSKVITTKKSYGMVPARSGYRLSNAMAIASWLDSCLLNIPSNTTRVSVMTSLLGTNGLTSDYPSAEAWAAAYLAWGQARRTAGWKWCPATILPIDGDSVHNSRRATVNTAIRSWVGLGYCDAVVDVAGDATIGPDAAASNATYYADGKHLTDAGHTIAATYFKAAIDSLL